MRPEHGWWLSNRCPLLQRSSFPENKLFCCSGLLLTSAFSLKKKKKKKKERTKRSLKLTQISWEEEHMSDKTHLWPCFFREPLQNLSLLKSPSEKQEYSACVALRILLSWFQMHIEYDVIHIMRVMLFREWVCYNWYPGFDDTDTMDVVLDIVGQMADMTFVLPYVLYPILGVWCPESSGCNVITTMAWSHKEWMWYHM